MTGKVSDAVAEKLAMESEERKQKEAEERQRKAHRVRMEYLLKLNEIGLHEMLILEYGKVGIMPRATFVGIEGTDRIRAKEAIEAELARGAGIVLPR